MWVLGTKPRPSSRRVSALNLGATFPVLSTWLISREVFYLSLQVQKGKRRAGWKDLWLLFMKGTALMGSSSSLLSYLTCVSSHRDPSPDRANLGSSIWEFGELSTLNTQVYFCGYLLIWFCLFVCCWSWICNPPVTARMLALQLCISTPEQ